MKKLAFLLIHFLLSAVLFSAWAADIFVENGIIYRLIDNHDCEAIGATSDLTDVCIPKYASDYEQKTHRIIGIADGAFLNNTGIKSLSVTNNESISWFYIGEQAFKGCTSLASIDIPAFNNAHRIIKDEAFRGCSSLKELSLYNFELGNYVFADCTGLESLYLCLEGYWNGGGLNADYISNTIGNGAFQDCSSLKFFTSGSNHLKAESVFDGCVSLQKVVGNSTIFGMYLFYGLPKLQEVEIIDCSLEEGAFMDCKFLRKFSWKDRRYTESGSSWEYRKRAIPAKSFAGCIRLTDLDFDLDFSTIGPNAFKDCVSLKDFTFTNLVTFCDPLAFNGCMNLNTLNFLPYNDPYKEETAGQPLEILANTFAYLPLEYLSLGRAISGMYTDVPFADFAELKQLEVYGDFTDIPDGYFSNCSVLEKVTLGHDVKSLGVRAFANCPAVTEFVCDAVVPPVCGSHVFDGINTDKCTLVVPQGSEQAYMAAPEWRKFYGFDGIEAPLVCEENTLDGVYNLNGARIADTTDGLAPGFYLVRTGKNVVKRVIR